MASRLCSENLLLATPLDLSESIVKERLMAREDGAKLELVGCVQLGSLLLKVKGMAGASKSCMLRDQLLAQGIFCLKET